MERIKWKFKFALSSVNGVKFVHFIGIDLRVNNNNHWLFHIDSRKHTRPLRSISLYVYANVRLNVCMVYMNEGIPPPTHLSAMCQRVNVPYISSLYPNITYLCLLYSVYCTHIRKYVLVCVYTIPMTEDQHTQSIWYVLFDVLYTHTHSTVLYAHTDTPLIRLFIALFGSHSI